MFLNLTLTSITNFISKNSFHQNFKDPTKSVFTEENSNHDYDLEEFEEVFADHILLNERLRRTLYAGDFSDLDELPEHPPMALTGLALEIFSKSVSNTGLDRLNMDYVSSVSRSAKVSPYAMLIAMIYLERLQLKDSEYLENVSPTGLFVVTMMVASKFLFDDDEECVNNQLWAEALNIDIKELNELERKFLSAIEWKVFVDSSEYFSFLEKIEKRIALTQSRLRDWLSYSDISVLLEEYLIRKLWKDVVKKVVEITIICSIGYVATIFLVYNSAAILMKLRNELDSSLPSQKNSFCLDAVAPILQDTQMLHNDSEKENFESYTISSVKTNSAMGNSNWFKPSVATKDSRRIHICAYSSHKDLVLQPYSHISTTTYNESFGYFMYWGSKSILLVM